MEVKFADRQLKCFDCGGVFIFTAGEQVFFSDKKFKNDPKRCKPCKAKRTGVAGVPVTGAKMATGVRLETRTECSACGVQTTVPFRPTQGRPVLCRECFQAKARGELLPRTSEPGVMFPSDTITAHTQRHAMSVEEAVQMSSAVRNASACSSVSTPAEMASIADLWPERNCAAAEPVRAMMPVDLAASGRKDIPVQAAELMVEQAESILA